MDIKAAAAITEIASSGVFALDPKRYRCVRYVPPTYGRVPTTPAEALDAAACVLEEEGRWVKETWYKHHDPTLEEFTDNPFCNGWSACADGALQAVTIGAFRTDDVDTWFLSGVLGAYVDTEEGRWRNDIYQRAYMCVSNHIDAETDGRYCSLPRFNDNADTTRDDVVSMLRSAADYARQQEAA